MTASERKQGQDERLATKHRVEADRKAEMAQNCSEDDEALEESEDDLPLSHRRKQNSAAPVAANGVASDSEDDMPIAARISAAGSKVLNRKLSAGTAVKQVVVKKVAAKMELGGGSKRPLDQSAAGSSSAKKLKPSGPGRAMVAGKLKEEPEGDENEDEDNDDIPLAQRKKVQAEKASAAAGVKRPLNGKASTSNSSPTKKVKPSLPAKAKEEPSKVKAEPTKTKVELSKAKEEVSKAKVHLSKVKEPTSKTKVEPSRVKAEPSRAKDEPDTDEDDDIPLSQRMSVKQTVSVKKTTSSSGVKLAAKKVSEVKKTKTIQVQKVVKKKEASVDKKAPGAPGSGGGQKWTTLHHNGVIFPPPYQQHGVKVLYDGKPVDLTDKQEEVATMFAVMKDTEYATKERFIQNFWNDWKAVLGSSHVIKKFELCDFSLIYEWAQREKEKKKQMSTEEKKKLKDEKMKMEEKYMWALVDGVKEKVGNFRVEPPGLFRGRGDHPKMGKLKKRILPKDIVINISKDAPVPECPIPNSKWKEVRHDNTVTWLAYWNDPINPKEFKYVFLAASSNLKGQSDKEKYEKSRTLKNYIENIRKTYTKNFSSTDMTNRQIAVATYLIDRLALRAGNEKDDDEADTVGCCSLKVEHVTLVPPRSLEFDFLGKDSIRYNNTVEVVEKVYKAIGDFKKGKKEGQDLFDKLDTSKLNAHLKGIMPNLTAKVFRTYNASITLDNLLFEEEEESTGNTVVEKIAGYQRANKEVAILCNHQRTVSKTHGAQMERLQGKMAELESAVEELMDDLEKVRKGKPLGKDKEGKPKRNVGADMLEKKIAQHRNKIEKMKLDMTIKDDLKTVALGTSKINYMDPRITVAWCKRHEVPIEKIFNKSLLAKFAWAMDVEPEFRF